MPSQTPGRPSRIRAEMMPTGWTYVLLSPFLAALVVIDERAAVLVVCWVAIGLLQILLARANFAGLRLSMELETPRTRVGRGVPVHLHLTQNRRWGASRALSIQLRHAGEWKGQWVACAGPITHQRHATVEAMVTPLRFGRLFINVAEVSSTYPFGLYGLTAEWLPPPTGTLTVWPRQHRLPFQNEHTRASSRDIAGTQVLPGIDVRPYREGDPLATVCWKSSARTGRLHVRPREIDAHRPRVLVVSSLRSDWASLEQFWRMVTVACAILEEGYRRKTLSALQLDNRTCTLATPNQFVQAMDALAVIQPRKTRAVVETTREPTLNLRPRGKRGVSLINERGALVHHVA